MDNGHGMLTVYLITSGRMRWCNSFWLSGCECWPGH